MVAEVSQINCVLVDDFNKELFISGVLFKKLVDLVDLSNFVKDHALKLRLVVDPLHLVEEGLKLPGLVFIFPKKVPVFLEERIVTQIEVERVQALALEEEVPDIQ